VMVGDRVLLLGRTIYAESRRHVFRKHVPEDEGNTLRLGDAVRDSRVIPLSGWECFPKAGLLPQVYLQAVTLE
jgi:hypothetical protein